MGIISVKEAQSHAQMVADRSGHNWTCPYIVEVDSARTGSFEIVNYFGDVLNRGIDSEMRYADEHDPFSYCDSIAPVRRDRSQTVWDVTLQYSTPTAGDDEREQREWRDRHGNPTRDPFAWIGSCEASTDYIQVPVWRAWNVDALPIGLGHGSYDRAAETLGPVVNSAGVVLDPPLIHEVGEHVMQIAKNVSYWSQDYEDDNGNHINGTPLILNPLLASDFELAVGIHEKYTIKCSSVRGSYARVQVDETMIPYWKVVVELRFRRRLSATYPLDGWLESVLDRGHSRGATEGDPDGRGGEWTGTEETHPAGVGHTSVIRGPSGHPTDEPVLLDGKGQPLDPASTDAKSGVYIRWRRHSLSSFQTLPFRIFDLA